MASALQICFGIPLPVGYLICAAGGHSAGRLTASRFISRMQLWTQPVWLVLQIAAVRRRSRCTAPDAFARLDALSPARTGADGVVSTCCCSARRPRSCLSLIAQIGEQVDYLRFLPRARRRTARRRLVGGDAAAGPGLDRHRRAQAARRLVPRLPRAAARRAAAIRPTQPTQMYQVAFSYVVALAGGGAGADRLSSSSSAQIKINVTNAYAGSIAWSNFFSRLTHSHPGRVVWLVFNVAHRAAADGARHLQAHRAHPGALFQRRGRPGSARWSPIWSSTSRWASARRTSSSSAPISTTSTRSASARCCWRSSLGADRLLRRASALTAQALSPFAGASSSPSSPRR